MLEIYMIIGRWKSMLKNSNEMFLSPEQLLCVEQN